MYEQAVELWGEPYQIDLLIEECAELIEAVVKERCPGEAVAEGVADVEIMLAQITMMVGEPLVQATKILDTNLIGACAIMIRLLIHRRRLRVGNDALATGIATLNAILADLKESGWINPERVEEIRGKKLALLSEKIRQGDPFSALAALLG